MLNLLVALDDAFANSAGCLVGLEIYGHMQKGFAGFGCVERAMRYMNIDEYEYYTMIHILNNKQYVLCIYYVSIVY